MTTPRIPIATNAKNLKILNKEKLPSKKPQVDEEYIDADIITPYEFTVAFCENAAENGVLCTRTNTT